MSKAYNKLHPEQARAKWLVQKQVQRGMMVKPHCCQLCKEPFPPEKLHAHHYDYNKPLDVAWYCDTCHKKVHKELGKDWKTITTSSIAGGDNEAAAERGNTVNGA